jgi:hypothetical protein
MKPTIPIKGALEADAFSPWRKMLAYMSRAGVAKKAKRAYHKRERRIFKQYDREG